MIHSQADVKGHCQWQEPEEPYYLTRVLNRDPYKMMSEIELFITIAPLVVISLPITVSGQNTGIPDG